MNVSLDQIKELRTRTGAGVVDAKEALTESSGDLEKAIMWLREKGKAKAAKKAERATSEGVIGTYVHSNHKIGVMVALQCETDFVARNQKFQELARNIAMHIAATDPAVINPEDVSPEELAAEKDLAIKQLKEEGKPEDMMDKILEGKMKKLAEEHALLTQPYVKDPKKTIQAVIEEAIQELGENITVAEFKRLAI